ncbi:MAG: RHS repeat-associated core domain-containing protein, partial [Bacteroidota bacterium]
ATEQLVVEPGQFNGNIQGIRWQTRTEVHPGEPQYEGQQLIYMPQYDQRHRLIAADFGTIDAEHIGIQNTAAIPQTGVYDGPDPLARNDYKVWGIQHDPNGNITQLSRNGNISSGVTMDQLTLHRDGNRLVQVTDLAGATPAYGNDIEPQPLNNYAYDASGRLTSDQKEQNYLAYNSKDLTTAVYDNTGRTSADLKATYGYDEHGKRLLKKSYTAVAGGANTLASKQYYIRDIGGTLMAIIHDDVVEDAFDATEMPVYGSGQLGFFSANDAKYRYQVTDHLGNVRATIKGEKDGQGEVELLSMQDYYPFGSEMPGRSISGSFVFQQGYQRQPKDGETGFNAFELRLYDSRLGGWLSPDPYNQHYSPYMAMSNNPFSFFDPDGGKDTKGKNNGRRNINGIIYNADGTIHHIYVNIVTISANRPGSLSGGGQVGAGTGNIEMVSVESSSDAAIARFNDQKMELFEMQARQLKNGSKVPVRSANRKLSQYLDPFMDVVG